MAATDDVADDAGEGTPSDARSGARAWLTRILDGPSSGREPPPDSPRGRRRGMERLDPRERRYSFAAGLAAVLFAAIIYFSETRNHSFRLAKGQLTPQTTLLLGLAAGVLMGIATYSGRRAPVAFVGLFSFFIFSNGGGIVVGLPFIGLAGWLLYRSYKIQRQERDRTREARGTPTARDRPKDAPARAAPSRQTSPARKKTPARPEANKRFTPKRPPPNAPKPSRRERKAAETKD